MSSSVAVRLTTTTKRSWDRELSWLATPPRSHESCFHDLSVQGYIERRTRAQASGELQRSSRPSWAEPGVFYCHMKDQVDHEIPADLLATFTEARRIRKWTWRVRKLMQGLGCITDFFGNNTIPKEDVLLGFSLILKRIEQALPFTVCLGCKREKQCTCGGKGWLTEPQRTQCLIELQARRTSARDTSRTARSTESSSSRPSMPSRSSTASPESSTSSESAPPAA